MLKFKLKEIISIWIWIYNSDGVVAVKITK